jgi:hypothetical protein
MGRLVTFPIRDDFLEQSATRRTLLAGQQTSVCRFRHRMKAGDCAQDHAQLGAPKRSRFIASVSPYACSLAEPS